MINKVICEKSKERFCREFLEEIYEGPIPDFVDPVRNFKRLLRSLPKNERTDLRSIFLRYTQSLDQRIVSAITVWISPWNIARSSALEFCGFTLAELKIHIEKQFEPWMAWENWGEWHIDHIIPRKLFDHGFSREQIFGLQNLRPISRAQNLAKGSKYG